jgi:uncharacterized protein (TIGR00369 family)
MADTPSQPERFADLVGYRLAAWRDDHAEIVLTLGLQHVNRTGRLHGGVLCTLIDAACGYAGTFAVGGTPRNALTLALTTQFLAPAHAGQRLTATGRRIGGGRRIFFAAAEVHDEAGRLVARGDGTFRYSGAGS